MGAVDKILAALRRQDVFGMHFAKSSASIEAKIIDVVGTYADSEAIERENTLNVISNALASQKVTGVEYYRRKAVEYQPNSTLAFDSVNQGAYYPDFDPNQQLVKQACIVGDFPRYALRVNKIGENGHLVKLTEGLEGEESNELAGFASYFEHFQPLGLTLAIQTFAVARISDPNLVVYIQPGYDAQSIAASINEAFKNLESVLRTTNKVSVTELSDTIQSVQGVRAVAFSPALSAIDTNTSGQEVIVQPEQGLFNLTTNAFSFVNRHDETQPPVTAEMIKVLQ